MRSEAAERREAGECEELEERWEADHFVEESPNVLDVDMENYVSEAEEDVHCAEDMRHEGWDECSAHANHCPTPPPRLERQPIKVAPRRKRKEIEDSAEVASAVETFLSRNTGIDEETCRALRRQPPGVQRQVIGEGHITGKNLSAVLRSRISRHAAAAAQKAPRRVVGEVAEVWYQTPDAAQMAIQELDGITLRDCAISVVMDNTATCMTKLVVYGLPEGIQAEDLREILSSAGAITKLYAP